MYLVWAKSTVRIRNACALNGVLCAAILPSYTHGTVRFAFYVDSQWCTDCNYIWDRGNDMQMKYFPFDVVAYCHLNLCVSRYSMRYDVGTIRKTTIAKYSTRNCWTWTQCSTYRHMAHILFSGDHFHKSTAHEIIMMGEFVQVKLRVPWFCVRFVAAAKTLLRVTCYATRVWF